MYQIWWLMAFPNGKCSAEKFDKHEATVLKNAVYSFQIEQQQLDKTFISVY